MKYISMQQKMLVLLLVFALGCGTMQASQTRLPINHGDSAVLIMKELSCDEAFAGEIRHLLMNFDSAIFAFLHYKGNKQKYGWHISQFDAHLKSLNKSIVKAKDTGHTQAAETLEKIYKNLTELRKHIHNAQGSKGFLAAVSLGKNIDPVIKDFGSYMPSLSLTVEDELKKVYGHEVVNAQVYLNHLQKRLEIK